MIKGLIESGDGNGVSASVSSNGELITRPLEYSNAHFKDMNIADSAFNFVEPEASKRFIITGMILDADRNVGVNGANVVIFEADQSNSTTPTETILQVDMPKQTSKVITPLLIETTEGVYINGKTDDNDVSATILGYFRKNL